jgi:tol-pal system protein YbgF
MGVLRSICLVTGLTLGTGCAMMVPPEEDPMYIRMNQIDDRLTKLERIIDNEGLMNMLSQLEALQQETQALRNSVETLQYDVEQGNTRQRDLYLDIDQRLQAMEKTSATAQDVSVLEGGSLTPGQLPVPGGTDRANYQAAFELLKQGRYDQAGMALQQFMVTFPDSTLSDNAQYWLAETHYVTQDYQTALPEFQQVLEKYPDSRKLPDALLKIGYCNYELSQWDDARRALAAVVADYPETTAARLATQRLERMATEGR